MKKNLFALAALLAAGSAFAQSDNSVTLYGVADAYVGSKSVYQYSGYDPVSTFFTATKVRQAVVNSGGLSPSRIGVRVQENLGNGLSAFANFENEINLDTGSSNGARTSVVGLKTTIGSFALGRQASSYHDAYLSVNAQGESAFGAANGLPLSANAMLQVTAFRACQADPVCVADPGAATLQANTINTINNEGYAGRTGAWVGHQARFSNSLRYDSPDFNGFNVSATVGLGENKTATSSATTNGAISLNYGNGPLALSLAHQVEAQQVGAPIALPGSGTLISIMPAGSSIKLKNTLLGGSYDFGVVSVHAGYNVASYNIANVANQHEYLLGAVVPLGAWTLVGQYAHSSGNSLSKSTSVGLEAQYALSKRSTLYAAVNDSKLPSTSYRNSLVGFGIRHVF